VRAAETSDLEECNRVCRTVHGHARSGQLKDAINHGTAIVVERGGKITGYATALAFFGHAVAETNQDLQALISSATSFAGPGILVPTRNPELFRWCLECGLRVVQPMTLMTIGLYNEPAGVTIPYSWSLPSITTDMVSLGYSISAVNAATVGVARLSSHSLPSINVPASGSTTTQDISATI
jgi:hypothetical protein